MSNAINRYLSLIWMLSAAALINGCAHGVRDAQPGPSSTPPSGSDVAVSGSVVMGGEHGQVAIEFSNEDRRHIHDYYYRDHGDDERDRHKDKKKKKSPPGLAKRDELPPGLQKQIQRNGKLPPGLEGRGLPDELEHRLSPLPPNYIRLQVGRDIVLMDQRTRVTVDVIKNIFP